MRPRLSQHTIMFTGVLWHLALGVAVPTDIHAQAQGQSQIPEGALPVCPKGQPASQWTGCVGTWADPSSGGSL
jgi:hypothetical protein